MATIICSNDAIKVLREFPEADILSVEEALYHTSPRILIGIIKKQKGDDIAKRIEAVRAKCANGYAKNIDREMPQILWTDIREHYYYLTKWYINKPFPYRDIEAIQDISAFGFPYIGTTMSKVKVKNLWYLRKVLYSEFDADIKDSRTYKTIDDIDVSNEKGEKIEVSASLKDYVSK